MSLLKSPRTEAQRAAARANGAKSRGPITPEGKANSSHSNLRHGLLAKTVLLPGESRDLFLQLCQEFDEEWLPRRPLEHTYVQRAIIAQWRLNRCWTYERVGMLMHGTTVTLTEIRTDQGTWFEPAARDTAAFQSLHGRGNSGSVLQMSEMRYQRQFANAIAELRKYRAANPHPDQLQLAEEQHDDGIRTRQLIDINQNCPES